MNKREGLKERKERTVLDNPPSEETKLKMVEFLMKTMVPRVLAARKKEEEAKNNIKNDCDN